MKLISLDTETLSTKTNSLILEVGIIKIDVPSYADIDLDLIWDTTHNKVPQSSACEFAILALPFLEQVKLGRDVTQNTLQFHCKTDAMALNFSMMMKDSLETTTSIKESLAIVHGMCEEADEIWINGLSFDPCILKSLSEDIKDYQPLWKGFRAETDVRSFYRKFELNPDVSKYVLHTSIDDCIINLATVRELGIQMDAGTLKFRTELPYKNKSLSTS